MMIYNVFSGNNPLPTHILHLLLHTLSQNSHYFLHFSNFNSFSVLSLLFLSQSCCWSECVYYLPVAIFTAKLDLQGTGNLPSKGKWNKSCVFIDLCLLCSQHETGLGLRKTTETFCVLIIQDVLERDSSLSFLQHTKLMEHCLNQRGHLPQPKPGLKPK